MKRLFLTVVLLSVLLLTIPASAREQHRLFFSEYIEGSSYNKALEIYNGYATPDPIDLTYFEVRIYFNGQSTYSTISFPEGTSLAAGSVFVIAEPRADQDILDQADMTTGTCNFNGNDVVELVQIQSFEDDSAMDDTVDIIGVIGNTDYYAQDTTMVRQSDKIGVDTYDASDWDTYSQDTFTYLGSHTGPTPTAITLSGLSARASSPTLLVASVLLLGAVIVWRRQRA